MNSFYVDAMNNMKIFVCCCLLDFVIVLKPKFTINALIDLAEQNGIMRPNIFFLCLMLMQRIIFVVKKLSSFWLNIILSFMRNV